LTTETSSASGYVGRFVKRDQVALPKSVSADVLAGVLRLTNPGERAPASNPDPAVLAMRRDRMASAASGAAPAVVLDALIYQ
jgi:hypothetical protein